MKQCPSCLTTYTDDSLRFCLADGSILTALDEEQATMVRSSGIQAAEKTAVIGKTDHVRIELATPGTPSTRAYQPQAPPSSGSPTVVIKIIVAVIGIGLLALLLVGAAGAVYYYASGRELPPPSNTVNTKQPTASPTPVKDDRDELRDQIANLQRQLNEQKKATIPANSTITQPKQSATTTTARANSPGDGFLALRSLPNSEVGERILKIPHGATVTIGACGPVIKPVSRSGRWCQATYNGYSGWVFDAYLLY